jgi:hypothetical protein
MADKKLSFWDKWFWPALVSLLVLGVLLVFGIVWVVGQGPRTLLRSVEEKPTGIKTADRFAGKSREEIVEELRQGTSAVTPEVVTEALTVGPADGTLAKMTERRLTVKADEKVWEFSVAEDAVLTRTILPASAVGGQLPQTENIGWEALQVGVRLVAILEKDETGKQLISRRVNVIEER